MTSLHIGVVAVVGCLLLGRALSNRASRTLTTLEQETYAEVLAGLKTHFLIWMALAVVVLLAQPQQELSGSSPAAAAWAVLLAYLLGLHALVGLQLKRRGLGAKFLRRYALAKAVSYLGVVLLLLLLLAGPGT